MERIAGGERSGKAGELEQDFGAAVFIEMQAPGGRAPRHRADEVDEVAVAVGARADHRIGEDDRVRFAPGDLLAEAGPRQALIGRAGKRGLAAERLVRLHQPPPRRLRRLAQRHQLGMDQVDRADIERGRHAHPTAPSDQLLDEIEARLAMIEAAVDMGLRNRDQRASADRLGEGNEDLHRPGRRRASFASAHGALGLAQPQAH